MEFIKKNGYRAEEHFVMTTDGYILALHRIPGHKNSQSVLVHHALLESSFCWIIKGRAKSLGLYLYKFLFTIWILI